MSIVVPFCENIFFSILLFPYYLLRQIADSNCNSGVSVAIP